MKKYLLLFLFCIACQAPSEPLGIKINYERHYETIDFCRGIDVSNSVLVAATNHNGYMRYNIIDEEGYPTLELANHISDLVNIVGDDAAYDVLISNNIKDMAFILDDVDNIILEHFDDGDILTLLDCGNSRLYRSIVLNDDIQDTTILFTLQKHFEELPDGFFPYSTSVGIREFYNTEIFGDVEFESSGCDAAINLDIEAMKIFYSDNILTVADGGLGVQIYRYNRYKPEEFIDSSGNGEYDEGEEFVDTNQDGEYSVIKDYFEYKDNFYIQGGSAESLFSINNFVFGGFDNDRGCYMALLDLNGSIISNLTFADGYSINAIDYDNGILALAAGNDGVIIYEWTESPNLNLKGILSTGDDNYVYDLKVSGENIYIASEDGISIYKIGI